MRRPVIPRLQASRCEKTAHGARLAAEWLARLWSQQTEPHELAEILAALYGPSLRGFCGEIEAALRTTCAGRSAS